MNFSENIKDLGLLSELAYLKLEDEFFSDEDYSYIKIDDFFKSKINTDNEYNGTGVDDSTTSMLAILNKYDIKHFKSFSSGLQLMILEDKSNPGEYVLSFRGTEFNLFSADITSDFEMALGNETDQMRDALNYVKDLQQNGIKADDGSVIVSPLTKENTTVTGHSLGGALAQYIGYNTGFETYTFNGFGMKKNEATEGKPFSEEKDTSNIHNFYLGIDTVSTFASEIGGYTGGQVYEVIKDSLQYIPDNKLTELQKLLVDATGLAAASIINKFVNEHYSNTFLGEMIYIIPSDGQDFWDNISDHFMSGFNESLELYSSLEKIFETSDISTINSYINELAMTRFEDINSAINVYNNINTNSMPKAVELIYDALVGIYPNENVNYDDISIITDSLAQIVNIVENNGGIIYYSYFADAETLLESAKESKGLMYALINNISPIIVNNPEYELYQDVDISNMSDKQLNDKALMYYHLITIESDTLVEKIDFIDYSNNVTTSSTLTNDININTKKVIFGSNDESKDENLIGTANDDRIYGNAGDDNLVGNNGANYLDGGSGNDTLEGGINDDTLIGGLGNDTIEAGQGTNYIDGGTGSDTISYKNITNSNKEGINLNLSLATAQAINSTTTDTLVNIENVIGSRYDDFINFDNTVILKDKKIHILEGYDGSDKIYGAYNSVNVIYGNTKEEPFGSKGIFNFGSNRDEYGNIIKYDDWLYGGKTTNEELLASGNLTENHLYGGSGDDFLLVGYNAHNYLYGGAGEDTLVSAMIGFKNEKAGIDFSYGSSYLNGGEGFDTYSVKDYVTIEDDDGRGEIQTKYGKLQDLTMRTFSDGRVLLLKNNPQYISVTTTSNPLAGYSSVSTQGMLLDNYKVIFKLQKDGNDLILIDSSSSNPTVIRIKNYTANSLSLNITQDMFNTLPNYDENNSQSPTPVNPILTGTNEVDTLIGSEVNNTFISNAGNDTLKDISGGNDIYKFKKGDGADTIYDIKGNDTIIFDESVLKEDITFSQSEDLKSLILNYSSTDSITITNYFDEVIKVA